jgi:hypothetical protein
MPRVPRGLVHPAADLVSREAAQPEPEAHGVEDAHVRVERVFLEHHGDVAAARRDVVDHLAADRDLARCNLLEPGDHPQCRRFAAARRADEHDELLVLGLEVDPLHGLDPALVLLHQPSQRHLRHRAPYPFVAPAVSPAMSSSMRNTKTTRGGSAAISAPAMICP